MFDLANDVFHLPHHELEKYDMGTTGNYLGYKRSRGLCVDEKGTNEDSQVYNTSKDDVLLVGEKPPLAHPTPVNRVVKNLRPPDVPITRSSPSLLVVLVRNWV